MNPNALGAKASKGIVAKVFVISFRKCKLPFNLCLHWRRLRDNAGDSDSHYLLALATLGDETQIGLFLFLASLPKVAKASTVPCRCC